jgi:hypothetical protein
MSWQRWLRVHGDEDDFFDAERLRMERMMPARREGRAGTKPGEDEVTPAVFGTLVEEAVRRDDGNGFYVTDETLSEG